MPPSAVNYSPFERQLTASYLAFSGNQMFGGGQQSNVQAEIFILSCHLAHQAIKLNCKATIHHQIEEMHL